MIKYVKKRDDNQLKLRNSAVIILLKLLQLLLHLNSFFLHFYKILNSGKSKRIIHFFYQDTTHASYHLKSFFKNFKLIVLFTGCPIIIAQSTALTQMNGTGKNYGTHCVFSFYL